MNQMAQCGHRGRKPQSRQSARSPAPHGPEHRQPSHARGIRDRRLQGCFIINAIATNASVAAGAEITQPATRTSVGQQSDPGYSFTSTVVLAPDVEASTQGSTLKVVVIEKEEELLDHA